MTALVRSAPNSTSVPAGYKALSEISSHPDLEHTSNSDLTPSETPPQEPSAGPPELQNSDHVELSEMDEAKGDGSKAKEGLLPPVTDNSTAQGETKTQETGDGKAKKAACRKHHKSPKTTKKRSKAKAGVSSSSGDSSSSDDSSSSSESEESTESESSSEEDAEAVKRRKQKAKKAKKLKEKRKAKSRKHKDSSEEEEESDSSDESSSEEDEKRKKSKAKKKRRPKKNRKDAESSESEEEENDSFRTHFNALNALKSQRTLSRRARGGRNLISDNRSSKKSLSSKTKSKKKKRGSKVDFVRVDQLWDSSIHNYKLTETAEDADADEYDQYVFTVRRKFDWENKYTDTVVDIKSKPLKEALNHVMGAVKGVSFAEETPTIDPNMLFLYLEETRAYMKELKSASKTEKKKKAKKIAATKAGHIKVLIKYLDKDYAEIKKTLYPSLESNTITFDLLWALFKSNEIAYCPTYSNADEPRAFKIEYATKESSFMKGTWYNIEGRYLEYDGKTFGMGTMEVEVEQFKGPRKISSLACYPLKYHKDADVLKQQLIDRGKKFVALKGMNYRFHKGMGFYKKKRQIIKVNINGRVMVDPAIHRRINPNYPISTVKPKDPDILDEDEDSEDESCRCCESSDEDRKPPDQLEDADKPKTKMKLIMDENEKPHIVEVEMDENGNEIQKEDIDRLPGQDDAVEREFSAEELLIASPVVLGFAFSEKLWLEFTVSGINDIDWNEGAFDSLVLPDNQKSIVKALVESHTFQASRNIDDVIQGKGRGLVAVLHGPPGTGKTLTAEGIAELLKCPLYMVSAGELGTNPRELEAELNKILDIAHSWGAVLLLDEADVFLEKRTIQDIHRNALVSIFLRLLEYFQGILFLTTNRVETFDDAFQSRIHVALRYGELTTKAKRTVWKMFLDKVKAKDGVDTADFKESEYDKLSRHNLNGRQIKNAVRTAQALAVNEKTPLSMAHIAKVLEVAETFEKDLKGGTGYEDRVVISGKASIALNPLIEIRISNGFY
ncbi:hypothetical protein MMC07_001097 [Pseudocyphellaria aurata]|nr:hypothetical protein [Pseudocyphellaria aurata]